MKYTVNMETLKGELTFSKEEYLELPEDKKQKIKSNFLFSRRVGGWITRAKYPNLAWPEKIARDLGAEFCGKTGEALSFSEQMERKAERAEARAERMEEHAANAERRGEALQEPINQMHGDIAFFTQPNINSSAGRAFTNRRNRMFSAYERGFEEFKKSEYFKECAETARNTAQCVKPTDKAFCDRRIRDAEKDIRAAQKCIETAKRYIATIKAGVIPMDQYGWKVSANVEEWENYLERQEFRYEQAIGKKCFYMQAIEELGGVQFSRENIKPGYILRLNNRISERVEVVSCGPKNFTAKTDRWPVAITHQYAEIVEIIEKKEAPKQIIPHVLGEEFMVKAWDPKYYTDGRYLSGEYVPHLLRIVKKTEKTVTFLDTVTGKQFSRKPLFAETYDGKKYCTFRLGEAYSAGINDPLRRFITA